MDRFFNNSHGLKIHVVEHLFRSDELYVLCHGFTGSANSHVIASIRNALTQQGISNVSIDFTNNLNESEGEFAHHTISGELDDLRVIYQTYQPQFQKIYLIGHSMGCTVAAQFALQYKVSGLLLIAPPYSIRDIILEIAKMTFGDENLALANWERQRTIPIYKERDHTHYPLDFEFYRDLLQIDTSQYHCIQAPVVILYSPADQVVPAEHSEQLFEELGSVNKKLVSIPNAPHSYDTPTATQALLEEVDQAVDYFKCMHS